MHNLLSCLHSENTTCLLYSCIVRFKRLYYLYCRVIGNTNVLNLPNELMKFNFTRKSKNLKNNINYSSDIMYAVWFPYSQNICAPLFFLTSYLLHIEFM